MLNNQESICVASVVLFFKDLTFRVAFPASTAAEDRTFGN